MSSGMHQRMEKQKVGDIPSINVDLKPSDIPEYEGGGRMSTIRAASELNYDNTHGFVFVIPEVGIPSEAPNPAQPYGEVWPNELKWSLTRLLGFKQFKQIPILVLIKHATAQSASEKSKIIDLVNSKIIDATLLTKQPYKIEIFNNAEDPNLKASLTWLQVCQKKKKKKSNSENLFVFFYYFVC